MIIDMLAAVLTSPLLFGVALTSAGAGVLALLPLRDGTGLHTGSAVGAIPALRLIRLVKRRERHRESARRQVEFARWNRKRHPGVFHRDVVLPHRFGEIELGTWFAHARCGAPATWSRG
ncbi:hypothetical protein GIY23_00530 [Allosaccharopolyspora coralli]|uniref:Uncharacterized protein n=1 Tax=Allosaccharopolyspora coralli TaxID=2665642 RepID=A0A5Q3Q0V8_9PSEU|nr:hypothetical protein [Allosaccharopolyspora coralli]QGK68258.1 hypothetical protein GIY23_00530 [Allosaccharopolyspora coralli]